MALTKVDQNMSQSFRDYLEYRDEKAAATDGGTFTSGSFATRTLNVEAFDTGGFGALSSNQVTLQPGTYEVDIEAPAVGVGNHQAKLQNVTDGTATLIGTSEQTTAASLVVTKSRITGRFTITVAKAFEVQHRCETTRSTDGLGNACNFGVTEVYTVARFWKVA